MILQKYLALLLLHKGKSLRVLLATLCLLSSSLANAIALGEADVLSLLGDPVEVEIDVLQWDEVDLERTRVSIASPNDYENFRLTYLPVLDGLNINLIGPNIDGKVKVLISTREPVVEPYIELLLVLRWPGGSLLREYVLLFDPPRPAQVNLPVAVNAPATAISEPANSAALPVQVPRADNPRGEPLSAASNEPEQALPALSPNQSQLSTTTVVTQVKEVTRVVPLSTPAASANSDNAAIGVRTSAAADNSESTEALPAAQATADQGLVAGAESAVATAVSANSDVAENQAATAFITPDEPPALPTPDNQIVATEPAIPAEDSVVREDADFVARAESLVDQQSNTPITVRNQIAIDVGGEPSAAFSNQNTQTGRRGYSVRTGDNLWDIARQFQPAGVGENLYQVLIALHDLNRSAFINANISLLKAGEVLQIPRAADIEGVNPATAQAIFEQRWEEGTRRIEMAGIGQGVALSVAGEISGAADEALSGEITESSQPLALERSLANESSAQDSPLLQASDTVVIALREPNAEPLPSASATPASAPAIAAGQGAETSSNTATDPDAEQQGENVGQTISDATNATIVESEAAPIPLSSNPHLERINESSRNLEALLESRALQIARLETQMVEMRIRMREAQEVAASLNGSLEVALENRKNREQRYSRNTTLLGSLSLVMLLLLLAALVMVFRLFAKLRQQGQLLSSDQRSVVYSGRSGAVSSVQGAATNTDGSATYVAGMPADNEVQAEPYTGSIDEPQARYSSQAGDLAGSFGGDGELAQEEDEIMIEAPLQPFTSPQQKKESD